jgi:hypothetical protein
MGNGPESGLIPALSSHPTEVHYKAPPQVQTVMMITCSRCGKRPPRLTATMLASALGEEQRGAITWRWVR